MFDEEESKKLRIQQRHERQELQLIVRRCNEVAFDYVCVPSIRSDSDLCFGSKTPRKIHLFADDKKVNSFMRKCFLENFPEPVRAAEVIKTDEEPKEEIEIKPTHPFASKAPRFQDVIIDTSGGYRRKKKKSTRAPPVEMKKIFSAFGSSSKRNSFLSRNPVESETPGVGVYNLRREKKHSVHHSFGGKTSMKPAFDIVCSPTNFDTKCESCEENLRNVYWKNRKTQQLLCRVCYTQELLMIRNKTRGILEKLHKLDSMKNDFEQKRYCDFYHEHNNTTAAIRLLSGKEFSKRIHRENFLNTHLS